jgi:FkbM family methyltransferase
VLKQLIARGLFGSPLFAPTRNIYRRFSRTRSVCTRNEVAFYSRFIEPGDLVFDIGANTGYKTEVFLACGARVVSVEPNPLCHAVLDYEFGSNSSVSLVKQAVGSAEDRLPLNIKGLATTASLRDDWEPFGVGYDGGGEAERVEVSVTTLDRLIEQYGTPDFIKIDIEGYEVEALKGLSTVPRYLSFEYGLARSDRLLACLALLRTLGAERMNVILDDPNSNTRELRLAFADHIPLDLDTSGLPSSGDCFIITATKPK